MANEPAPEPKSEAPEPDTAAQEAAYWKKMDARIDDRLDAFLERNRKQGTSRTGRTSFSTLFADVFFGPQKD
jgi:hypothetical protein